jgi:pseudouridine synthase
MKLHVYLRNAGVGSRRRAEEIIAQGRVMVDETLGEIGQQVTGSEKITVDGKTIRANEIDHFTYLLLNKPAGYTSTTARFAKEHSILELLPPGLQKKQWQIAGRLDRESTGIMLLTDNGNVVYVLTHPKYEVEKEYEVVVDRALSVLDMTLLRQGVKGREGDMYQIKRVSLKRGLMYTFVLTEGKKREIREAVRAVGSTVVSLKRIRLGALVLSGIKEGYTSLLSKKESEELEKYVEKCAR